MRLIKQPPEHTERIAKRAWRAMTPLLITIAVATVVTVSLPTKADVPKDKTAITVQAKAPERDEEQRKVGYAYIGGLAGIVVGCGYLLYGLFKEIRKIGK